MDKVRLTSADLVVVANKPVFTFRGVEGLDPRTLKDTLVEIDGQAYEVSGVETFAVLDATGMSFGLMVQRADRWLLR